MGDFLVRIAVCDDSKSDRSEIIALCNAYFSPRIIKAQYFEFSSGAAFLSDTNDYEILFLDVELGDSNGIDVMKQVEAQHNVWKIIFMTSHSDFMEDAFGLKTLGFIVKPATGRQLDRYLSIIYKELSLISTPLTTIPEYGDIYLPDILRIESDGSYYAIYLKSDCKKVLCCGSVSRFIASLNTYLLVCIAKGIYVNLHNVVRHTEHNVTLCDGTDIALSSRYRKDFTDKMMLYYRDFKR